MKSNVVSLKRIIKQLSYILTDAQKRAAIVVAIMMIISSGLELLGGFCNFPFFTDDDNACYIKSKNGI